MPETIQNTKSEKLANGSVVIKDSTGKIVKMLTGADAAGYKDTGITTVPTLFGIPSSTCNTNSNRSSKRCHQNSRISQC